VTKLAEVFRRQAEHFGALGSPVYARLAERLARDPKPARPFLGDNPDFHDPLRLFGAVNHLVLTGAAPNALSGDWEDFAAALLRHRDEIRRRVREQGVQTNEVQRCTALLPAFLTVARQTGLPLELLELGPSAGLNLLFDRYRYVYAEGTWGPAGAELELVADERGGRVPATLLAEQPSVRRRRGIDLAPVDATSEEGYLLLRSFVWPGLDDRVRRLDAAVATLRTASDSLELIQGDYVELLPGMLAERPESAVTVVFQTASTGYLAPELAGRLRRSLDDAGDDGRPLAWISTRRWDEREGTREDVYELELRVWPGPPRLAAHLDFHGNSLEWML
jgi:hypothetical protein